MVINILPSIKLFLKILSQAHLQTTIWSINYYFVPQDFKAYNLKMSIYDNASYLTHN